jgi:hypothetical protein
MIFLPYRRLIPSVDVFSWEAMFIEGEWIQETLVFKYLGIHLDMMCDSETHVLNCLKKAKQAAVQIGRLCRQMEITNFSQLRTYFFSFVVSQFHGQQLFTFPPEDYETALMLFFRTAFSVPIGFPVQFCIILFAPWNFKRNRLWLGYGFSASMLVHVAFFVLSFLRTGDFFFFVSCAGTPTSNFYLNRSSRTVPSLNWISLIHKKIFMLS